MQKFSFKMERVLRHKQWLEDEVKRLLGLEVQKLGLMRSQLKALLHEHRQLMEERAGESALSPEQHLYFIQYGNKLLEDAEKKKKEISDQNQVIKEKTEALNAAVKERKKLEKLRERDFESYRVYKRRKEAAIADEIGSNFSRRVGRTRMDGAAQ